MADKKRIGIFGWGVVAPKSSDVDAFEENLERGGTWLSPFREFGPSNFLVGYPDFDFETYHAWFDARFAPSKFAQLREKMGPITQYAMGAFIQSLSQNPGIEEYLQSLGTACHIYVGTGIGEITITQAEAVAYDRAFRRWNEFWASPERCSALARHLGGDIEPEAPTNPDECATSSEEWINAKHDWEEFWAKRSDKLAEYLSEAAVIQSEPVPPSSEQAKLGNIRQKLSRIKALNRKWACPPEPWTSVSSNLLWNIANIPASQISMIGRIMGPAIAPVAACASFGVALKLALNSIRNGDAKAVVIGMTDPPPNPLVISAFYNANVLSADGEVSRPMTGLKGTHVSGGSCIWIVGDSDELRAQGFRPLGLEIVEVGWSSDAHHIITPSREGPQLAIRAALSGFDQKEVATWDMHATATPGDSTEIAHSLEVLHSDVVFTARKGTFGHGMSVGGGWELTAQHMGVAKGHLFPAELTDGELHPDVRIHSARFVDREGHPVTEGLSGKLSMGIGGVNSCVISRLWKENENEE